MRRKDKEITDQGIVNEILEQSHVCRLGFTDGEEAYIVPVNFAYDGKTIYFHSAPSGRKIDLIKRNNRVSFEMELPQEIIRHEVPCEWSAKYRSLMGRGRIVLVDDASEIKKSLDMIMRKYGAKGELSYQPSVLSRMIVLKLEIESITGKQSGDW